MQKDLILAIESSCDDSSIAIIDKKMNVLFYDKIVQEHSIYGGVLPELAARLHTKALPDILEKTKKFLKDIDFIAVTTHPGLSVSLNPGIMMANALGLSLGVKVYGINHLLGHIYSLFLDKNALPCHVLLLSGGHSMVIEFNPQKTLEPQEEQNLRQKNENYLTHKNIKSAYAKVLLSTKDDSFGESFDKLCKMLDLGYPGGAMIEALAKYGKNSYHFSLPLNDKNRLEYSYSGIKNMAREYFLKLDLNDDDFKNLKAFSQSFDKKFLDDKVREVCNLCASFQNIAIAHAINKYSLCIENASSLGIVGGASANLSLREQVLNISDKKQIPLYLAPLKYCSDNALMIARAALGAKLGV